VIGGRWCGYRSGAGEKKIRHGVELYAAGDEMSLPPDFIKFLSLHMDP
jgi:hypothetical protein